MVVNFISKFNFVAARPAGMLLNLRAFNKRVSTLCLLSLLALPAVAFDDPVDAYEVTPTPDWVVAPGAYESEREKKNYDGFDLRYRLYHRQINVSKENSERYSEFAFELTNRRAVEENAQLEIEFDPSYEKLKVHKIAIIRNGQKIDKLSTSAFQLMQREQGLEQLIYDGTQTLAVILDDVRVGDSIRYSYTIIGDNPIYQGQREFGFRTSYGVPVDRLYLRVVADSAKPLNIRKFNSDAEVLVNRTATLDEYVIDLREVSDFSEEENVPAWRQRYGRIVFSELESWRSVVDWAAPMYSLDGMALQEVAALAEKIRFEHSEPEAQIGAALAWVQNEVRYFGVEMGVNSHQPSPPEMTMQRRFGDCKDKSLLLISLLEKLGIESAPALVNSDRGLENGRYPWRMHAFDHVIVHVSHNGNSHWLDPTLGYQKGKLGEFFEPNYGRALVLDEDSSGLVPMNVAASGRLKKVSKKIDIPVGDDPLVNLTVNSKHSKRAAKSIRYRLEDYGLRDLSESYQEYYEDYFDGLSSAQKMEVAELPANTVEINEAYNIAEFWLSDGEFEKYQWLFADEIQAYLEVPEDTVRTSALKVPHPINIEEVWEVVAPHTLRVDDFEGTEENEFFSLVKSYEYDEKSESLKVMFQYQSKTEEVSPEQLENYRDAIERADEMAAFYIEDKGASYNPTEDSDSESFSELFLEEMGTYNILNLVLTCLGFLVVGGMALYRFVSQRD